MSIRRPAAHEVFTDREGERERLRAFFKGLCATPMQRDKPILAFYGVGGVGKTSVKNEAARSWREAEHPGSVKLAIAECDVDAPEFTPDQPVMGFFGHVLRPALRKAEIALPLFDTFYCAWFGRSNPDTEMSRSSLFASALGVGEQSADLGSRVIEGLGTLGSTFKGTALAVKATTAFRDWCRRRTLAEKLPDLDLNSITLKQFDERAGDVLAVDLLTALAEEHSQALCIVIDGFERIQSRELRADLQNELQDLCARVLLSDPPVRCGVVILGRERLRWRELYDEPDNQDNHWDLYIEHSLLGGLAEPDARAFLRQVADWYQGPGRTSNERRVGELVATHGDAILRQAEEDPDSEVEATYYPYSLDLAIEQVIRHSGNFDPKVLGHGAKDLQARFLRDMDRRQRTALHVLAVALEFDPELFKHLVKEGVIVDYPVQGLHELVAPSYVIEDAERQGHYRFHRKMLDALLSDLMQLPGGKEQFAQIVEVLQRYYRTRIEESLTSDPMEAARAYDRAARIVIKHSSSGALTFVHADGLFDELTTTLSRDRHRYFNLDGRYLVEEYRLRLAERHSQTTDEERADRLEEMAILLGMQGQNSVARSKFERVHEIRTAVLGTGHPKTALAAGNLALLLSTIGEFSLARLLYVSALDTLEKNPGKNERLVVQLYAGYGALLFAQGDHSQAREALDRAMSLHERFLGREHASYAQIIVGLATVLADQSDYVAARALLQQALDAQKRILGPDHPETAKSLEILGVISCQLGDYVAGRALLEQAVAMNEQALGPEHPSTAESVANLAVLLAEIGKYEVAQSMLRRALAVSEKALGLEHPQTAANLVNLALLLSDQNRNADSMPLLERALAIYNKIFGADHPKTLETREALQTLIDCERRDSNKP